MWSRNYDKCINCGTTEVGHLARGLCRRCYWRETEQRHTSRDRQRGLASQYLSKEYLEEEYIKKQRSLSDIAKSIGCKRQYVCIKMSECGIPARSLSHARTLALERQKLTYPRLGKLGKTEIIIQKKAVLNEDFFSCWSKETAWVLGIVYTDGTIDSGKQDNPLRPISKSTATLAISQKAPELLYKIIRLMGSNARLYTVTGGALVFYIHNNKIYRDLRYIGLKTNKSLDMRFPDVPKAYLSHFIRGCWDGDGSVGFYNGTYRARFFCGSLSFIERLINHLVAAGLPQRNLYTRYTKRKNPFYSICFGEKHTAKLYKFLYKDTNPSCYLERKHELFKRAYNKYHNSGLLDIPS